MTASPIVVAGVGACDGDQISATMTASPIVVAGVGACDGDQI
jgi:hypothetical protein